MRKLIFLSAVLLIPALNLFGQEDPYPELGAKLEQYFVALAGEQADVQSGECDFLIESCEDSLVRQYVALKIWDHYSESNIMGDDAVAVHIADKWFLSGKIKMKSGADLFAAQIFSQFNRSSLVGMQAPSLELFSPKGDHVIVPETGSYSVLYFYDVGCATCKKETPRFQKLISSGKYEGLKVFAIYVGSSAEEWTSYRADFTGVTHLWDPDVTSDWQMLYGVLGTPRMFLVGPDGTIIGRGLDTPALELLLNKEFSREEYVYGQEAEMEKIAGLFSVYGDTIKVADIMSVADYMAARTFGEGDINTYKQIFGDILYYLFSQKTEVYRDAAVPFIDKYINLPEVWNTEADKAQVTSLASLMAELAARTPAGTPVPDIKVPGVLRRKPGLFAKGSREGEFSLARLKGNPSYVVFYTGGCSSCKETLAAVDALVSANRKVRILLVDMDTIMSDNPDLATKLLDSFDLSALPFVIQLDRGGIVLHRYVQL